MKNKLNLEFFHLMNQHSFCGKSIGFFALAFFCFSQLYSQDCASLPVFNRQFNNQTVNQAQTFTGLNIRITGTVNFNANITMVRCTVLMDPGAVLNINNSTFSLLNNVNNRSVIFGCQSMWQSINVSANSAVIFRNSDIRDGIQGLVFAQGFLNGTTEITGCNFSQNSTAITANNVNNLTFSAFTGNNFIGSIPPFTLLPPHVVNSTPLSAIRLSNCSGSIGTSGAQNIVQRMSVGARITNNSNVTFNNVVFSRCLVSDNQNGGTGIGINSNASSLTMQNIFSFNSSCRFLDNGMGINSAQTIGLTVKNATFTGQRVSDIVVNNSTNPYNVDISSNTMNLATLSGQSILLNRAAQNVGINTRIQSNIINLPNGQGVLPNAIRIINITSQAGATDQAVIANNQITCAYGNPGGTNPTTTIDGIFITGNSDGYQVSGNIISYPFANAPNANVVSVAIGVLNVNGVNNLIGPNNTITTNRFFGQPNQRDSWLRCGIHIDNSPTVAVCKNDVDDPRHDYHFLNNCANIEFGRNKIRDGIFGLEIWGQIPNNHDFRMNEWVPGSVYNTMAARTFPAQPNLLWRVDGSNGNPFGFLPPSVSPNGFFVPVNNGQTSGTPVCDAALPPPGAFGVPATAEMVHQFLNNEYGGMSTTTSVWDFERNLLSQMIRFPATFAGKTEAEQYYNGKVNSTVWMCAKAERMLHEAAALSNIDQQNLSQLNASLNTLVDSLGKIEQLEGVDTLTTNGTWQAGKTSLLSQIDANQAQFFSLNSTILTSRLNKLESVRHYIEYLPETTGLETNFKTLLLLKVKQQSGDEWTTSDYAALRAIAYSCPATGGEAVTIAREMLPSPEAYSFGREGADPLCGEGFQGSLEDRSQSSISSSIVTIWPNPVDDLLIIDFGKNFTGTIDVLNLSGITIHSSQVDDQRQMSLSTLDLPNGVYILRFTAPGQSVRTQKFSVIR